MARSFFKKKIFVVMLDDIEDVEIPNALLSWWIELTEYRCLFRSQYDSDASMVRAIADAVSFRQVKSCVLIDRDGSRILIDQKMRVLGRQARKCGVVIDDPAVSGVHCCILLQNGRLFIQDMGATNGTRVNSQIVPAGELREIEFGDLLSLGDHELRVAGADGGDP